MNLLRFVCSPRLLKHLEYLQSVHQLEKVSFGHASIVKDLPMSQGLATETCRHSKVPSRSVVGVYTAGFFASAAARSAVTLQNRVSRKAFFPQVGNCGRGADRRLLDAAWR